jgi:hypothetical protein
MMREKNQIPTQQLRPIGDMTDEPDQQITLTASAFRQLGEEGQVILKDEVTGRTVQMELKEVESEDESQFAFDPADGGNLL